MYKRLPLFVSFVLVLSLAGSASADLIGHWTFDDGSGAIAADSSGNGNDGVLMGDPEWVAGKIGGALDFDGDGDFVDCGYDPLFDITTNEMTVSAWVTVRSIANQWAAIAAKGEHAWRLGNASWDPRFHFGITIWNAPDTASQDGIAAVGADEWHHVAGVFDGTNIMIYLDGVLDVSVATTEPIGTNALNLFIGDNPEATGRYWDGLIDDVRLYNQALTQEEIIAIIPEPATLALLGLGGLALLRRKRK
jgi:hypothetical protein